MYRALPRRLTKISKSSPWYLERDRDKRYWYRKDKKEDDAPKAAGLDPAYVHCLLTDDTYTQVNLFRVKLLVSPEVTMHLFFDAPPQRARSKSYASYNRGYIEAFNRELPPTSYKSPSASEFLLTPTIGYWSIYVNNRAIAVGKESLYRQPLLPTRIDLSPEWIADVSAYYLQQEDDRPPCDVKLYDITFVGSVPDNTRIRLQTLFLNVARKVLTSYWKISEKELDKILEEDQAIRLLANI